MALILPEINGRTLRTFPRALKIRRKEENEMMKNLKQLLLIIALVAGISISASAQKDGDKKPPPKEAPPTIPVKPEKKPKEEKPKDNDKKPQFMMYKSKYTISLVEGK